MSKRFKGIVNVDIRDSVPDWTPFEAPVAPDGAPNVVYIVLDDVGFSALGSYGGPIETPNIDRIVGDGLRYTQMHTTALCSPTRSCLLTGRNHTRNSMACITEAAIGFPNASGVIPPENGQIQEILAARGWNTYMVGKWHLCPDAEMNLASSRRNWPTGRGFERFYGFLGAETNQWYPDLIYDSHPVDPPRLPEAGYHLTEDLTDKALEFIKDAKVVAPEKPFFLYYAPGACHAPHHAPKEWIEKFKGHFDMGYEEIREQTLARQKQMGIVPATTQLPPINPIGTPDTRTGPDGKAFPALDYTRPWDSLSADERRLFCRMAEVYAGFMGHADAQIGRLLDYLEETGQRENTVVVVISDNGASGEGGPDGSVNEMKFANGIPDSIEANLALLDELGGPRTYNHYPTGWAMAFNTPFKMWKRYEFNGGTSDPCVISWPKGITARGEVRDQYHHAIDLVPTILDALGVDPPETIGGHVQTDFDGMSMRYSFDAPSIPTARTTQFYSMLGSRAIWHSGWKAVTNHPTISGWGNFGSDTWELYHTDVDRSELRDRASEEPERLHELINLWYAEAGANDAFPLDDRSALEIIVDPQAAAEPGAQPVRVLPRRGRGARVPGGQRPEPLLQHRCPRRHPGAGGRGRAVRPRLAVRRALPVCQGEPVALCLQLRGHARADGGRDRGRAHRRESDPVGQLRQGRGGPARRCHGDAVAVSRGQEGRRAAHQDPARQVHARPARGCASGATAANRLPPTTPVPIPTRSPAAPSTASPSTSAASPTSTSSARRRR